MATAILQTCVDCPLMVAFWGMLAGCVWNRLTKYRHPAGD
jgi:hypothetical protein